MLRFGSSSKTGRSTRNYSSRREQLRLLALLVPLGLVILLMVRLRDPKTAAAINAFFAPAEQHASIAANGGDKTGAEQRPVIAESQSRGGPAPIPGLRSDLLKTIEDNTYFRSGEKDAWFHFFELLRKHATDGSQGVPIEYAQLVDQPEIYRGKLVTVRGTARQISQEKPSANSLKISEFYRVIIQPADGANCPIIVYCLELPQGISSGDNLAIDVVVTGLFFKKLSYAWQNGLGIAPVILAKSFVAGDKAGATAVTKETPVVENDDAKAEQNISVAVDRSVNGPATFQTILALAGWDAARLAQFDEGDSLSEIQRIEALELLHRLRSVSTAELKAWARNDGLTELLRIVDDVRGRLCKLTGLVTKVRQLKPAADDAQRLEMPVYFECEFKASEVAGPITIITARVPSDWLRSNDEHHNAAANVLFVKRLTGETPPRTLWLAKEIAWYPRLEGPAPHGEIDPSGGNTSDPRLGKSLLGALKLDVGKFDQVGGRGPIRAQERDLFYETLHASRQISPSAFVRFANGNLQLVKRHWDARLREGGSSGRALLAREVVRRADEGRYSVALLFNDSLPQRGRLFMFDGVARRALRVEVGGLPGGNRDTDVAKRLGINHYYELEVFTDDSQNYPLIFCAAELPNDFPIGPDIRVPVRVAGFFFKNWLYTTRGRSQSDETADQGPTGSQAQFAPLLIGRAPIVLPAAQTGGKRGKFVLGGLFILALAGIWAAAVWVARDDRRFRERTRAANFELPDGQSLKDLNLPTIGEPMMDEVPDVGGWQVLEKSPQTNT